MTQAQELWAIKSPNGRINYDTITSNEFDSWDEMKEILKKREDDQLTTIQLYNEGFKAVRVRVEEIEEGGE